MSADIQEALLQFLEKNFLVERDEIVMDTSLVDQGIIDSFGLIEISAFMEQQWGITVREDEMNRENFGSVLRIVDFIERRRS